MVRSQLKEGSPYPALYRLEEAGEVSAVWEKESQGRRGPRGRIYRLTTKGHRKPAQGRGEWQTFVAVLGGILPDARLSAERVISFNNAATIETKLNKVVR